MYDLRSFSNVKVLVVGDIMVDQYWWGSVSRISPEAPVPVVRLTKTSLAAGGAANVAANVAGLGAEPILIGVIGADPEAKLLPEILAGSGISGNQLVEIKGRPTTVKTRVVAHSQQVVRIDQESNEFIDQEQEGCVWEMVRKYLDKVGIIIVSDYAKGLLTESLLGRLITAAKETGIPIIVDPKGRNYGKYRGATLLTPNKREAADACGLDEDGKEIVEEAGRRLMAEFDLEALLITKGEEGMSLFRKGFEPLHQKASARAVYDVTGAGDTVIATMAVALGAGVDLPSASALANKAAGLVVEKIGTTTITYDELNDALADVRTGSSNQF